MEEDTKKQPDGSFKYYRFNRFYALIVVAAILAALILFVLLALCVSPQRSPLADYEWSASDKYDAELYPTLTVAPDGRFKIMQVSELHILSGGALDRKSLDFVGRAIDAAQPDLLVVTGDLSLAADNAYAFSVWNDFISEKGVKWAFVFGNHDSTGYADKTRLCKLLGDFSGCLFRQGPTNLADGRYDYMLGNYQILLADADGQTLFSLIFMDSGEKGKKGDGRHATFTDSQVAWYEWLVNGTNADAGKTVKSMAFFHIPLPQYAMAADAAGRDSVEGLEESIYVGKRDSGLFDSMKRLGSTVATFCGHDHENTFALDYEGLKLCYGGSAGYTTHGRAKFKCVRIVELDVFEERFTTEILFEKDIADILGVGDEEEEE